MFSRRLPVRPDLEQLKHQAKDLLRAVRAGDPSAIAELEQYHPKKPDPASVKLADAQLVLARAYEAPSWTRLVQACELVDAIWRDDVATVRAMIERNPRLLHESALRSRRSRSCCSTTARTRTCGRPYESSCTPATGRRPCTSIATSRRCRGVSGFIDRFS